ncbi:response regulator [Ketobacter alkanivorans]|uniref:Two-component system response regulator BaeR n=1 Tax=Ketobacter alkanivorans TaxID=1917421 RepID=A0A2K9LIS8_9GAMM|nr:response regulator [Ketobacter alkanivorans]AUM12150.1 two-component system response regulator BaeR [Ketobacter alkanivorans]
MNRIFIVEDEKDLAHLLEDYLRHHQFDTKIATDGNDVISGVKNFDPDLILLDLMLPNKDGLTLCKEIRSFSTVPIIMVTAKVEEIDRLLGLELGADDYICKPYSPREVVARVKAVLRRAAPLQPGADRPPSALIMDEASLSVSLLGRPLALTAVEFRLLKALSDDPRRIFSRDQLMDRIYRDHRIVHDRTIDSHINKLRKKLSLACPEHEVVHSVYGIGYKYELPHSLDNY